MRIAMRFSAGVLAVAAGQALGQAPVVNGSLGSDNYGPILFTQNQPTSFGNNVAGPYDVSGDPGAVNRGIEIAIPLSALGNPGVSSIRLTGFINGGGHDYLSNQIIGDLPNATGNLAEPRNVNFANIAGNQYIDLSLAVVGTPPAMDGQLDAVYGARKFLQSNYTGFGNNNNTNGVSANGSEIDGVYAVVYNNGTPANAADDVLYILIAGNLETNFNKLDLFFDTGIAGQNRLRGDNAAVDFNGLNRMGDDGSGNGLTFDTGFQASYWVGVTNGNIGGGNYNLFVNYAQLAPTGGGAGYYVGSGTPTSGTTTGSINPGGTLMPGDAGAPAGVLVTVNNSNTGGVGGSPVNITLPNADYSTGSEIDGVYGTVVGNRLYLLVTGNLETHYQKLDLFFDVNPNDGQNQLRGDNPDVEFNGLNRMGNGGAGTAGAGAGLKFDNGFTADYYLSITNGGGNPVNVYANAAVLRLNGPVMDASGFILDYSAFDGGPKPMHNPVNFPATYADIQDQTRASLHTDAGPRTTQLHPNMLVPGLIVTAVDNSNVGGVSGFDAPISTSGAGGVTTGIEISVDLDELGWDHTSPIKVAGFINSDGHGFVSNQVIGGLPTPTGQQYAIDLGEPTLIDFSAIAGNQYIVIPVTPPCHDTVCVADFDDGSGTGHPDGGVTIDDLLYYLGLFNQGAVCADIDDGSGTGTQDQGVTIDDLLYYLVRFNAGC